MDTFWITYPAGFILSYALINWRYKKEINIRLKWMNEKFKKGKWKFPLAIFFIFNLSMVLIRLIFGMVPNDFFLKPFFYGFFLIIFFTILLFKHFYEIVGGKREWKL
jgi:hypothetical protein